MTRAHRMAGKRMTGGRVLSKRTLTALPSPGLSACQCTWNIHTYIYRYICIYTCILYIYIYIYIYYMYI